MAYQPCRKSPFPSPTRSDSPMAMASAKPHQTARKVPAGYTPPPTSTSISYAVSIEYIGEQYFESTSSPSPSRPSSPALSSGTSDSMPSSASSLISPTEQTGGKDLPSHAYHSSYNDPLTLTFRCCECYYYTPFNTLLPSNNPSLPAYLPAGTNTHLCSNIKCGHNYVLCKRVDKDGNEGLKGCKELYMRRKQVEILRDVWIETHVDEDEDFERQEEQKDDSDDDDDDSEESEESESSDSSGGSDGADNEQISREGSVEDLSDEDDIVPSIEITNAAEDRATTPAIAPPPSNKRPRVDTPLEEGSCKKQRTESEAEVSGEFYTDRLRRR